MSLLLSCYFFKQISFSSESLYRGIQPVLISVCASNFVYFYTFHGLRSVFGQNKHSVSKDLLLGSLAGKFLDVVNEIISFVVLF